MNSRRMHKTKIGELYEWLPYFAMICLLVLIYIANVHRAEKKIRKTNQVHKKIEELRREYISIKQRSVYNGTLYEVTRHVEGVNMDEEVPMPIKIEKIDA